MPIRPDQRGLYPPDWPAISRDFGTKGEDIPEWLDWDALPVALVLPEAEELRAMVGESA